MNTEKPLILHVLYRLSIGGLENGVINLINHMPDSEYRHGIVAIDKITDFSNRLTKKNVGLYALNKKPGKDLGYYKRFYQLLKEKKPAIVHTRNLGAIDLQIAAAMLKIQGRVHSEHGWDTSDPCGQNKKNRFIRRAIRPFIHHHIGLSHELVDYQIQQIGVKENRISRIYNGVDMTKFKAIDDKIDIPLNKKIIFATVGRMSGVKDQVTLTKAFIQLCQNYPQQQADFGLVLVGDGDLKSVCEDLLKQAHLLDSAWLAGARSDIPQILNKIDVFILPSTAEGISNTILEAMASSRPVIATDVGGNSELVEDQKTGFIVAPNNPQKMAQKMAIYIENTDLIKKQGDAGRQRIEQHFSLQKMVDAYLAVYNHLLNK